MKKILIIIIVLFPLSVMAEGPIFRHKDPFIQQEFENIYKDLRGVFSVNGSSRCWDNPSLCIDEVNNTVSLSSASAVYLGANTVLFSSASVGTIGLSNGTAGSPALYFTNSPSSGLYRTAANRPGMASGGQLAYKTISAGASDGTAYTPLVLAGGVGTGGSDQSQVSYGIMTTASVSTSAATAIYTPGGHGGLYLVTGADGSGNIYCDLIMTAYADGTPLVVASNTISGSPVARTYTMASNLLKLQMASGSGHTASVYAIETVYR